MKVRSTLLLAAVTSFALTASLSLAQKPEPTAVPSDRDDAIQKKQDEKQPLAPREAMRDPRQAAPVPRPQQAIEKPADPSKVRATYELGGARVPITEGEFYDCYLRMERFEPKTAGRMVNAERVYEQILGFAEAKALGLEASPEEVAEFDPLAKNPELAKEAQARWEKEGVTREMYDAYQREARTIQKAKDFFVNGVRLLTPEVFETYRRDHYTLRIEYVEFPASRYADEIRKTPPTDRELEEFWNEDKTTQRKFLGQSNVTAEFVSFDPSAPSAAADEAKVERAEALEYYRKNKARLDTLIPSEQRAQMYPAAPIPLAEVKTPFQVLRETGILDREIRLSAKIRAAFAEARQAGSDLKAIAEKAGLQYEKVEKADMALLTQKYQRFGPQIFSLLFSQNPGDLSPDVRIEPQIQFFYRLAAKENAALPVFAEVKDKIREDYLASTSLKRAQTAAQQMRSWIDQKVDGEIRAKEEQLLKEADAAGAAEVETKKITDPKEIESIKTRHRALGMTKVRQLKDGLAPKYFDEYVKEHGLTLVDTGPVEIMTRRDMPGDATAKRRFLIGNPSLRNLEPGQITPLLTDAGTRTMFIARLAEKAEPDYSKVSDGDLLAVRGQTERARIFQPIQRWQYADISRRRALEIGAK